MNEFIRTSLFVLLLFMPACGTLQITVEGTPAPNLAATGTVGALQAQNSELATRIAALNLPTEALTATPSPQPAASLMPPTAYLPVAMRITFLNGATVGMVNAPIQAGQSQSYVLKAFQGQPMFVYVGSPNNDVTVSMVTQNGANILSGGVSWQGRLPQTGDYYLTIHGGASTENFSLAVTIPSPIQFASGATSATVVGNTIAGYDVSYTVYAGKGQNMDVELSNLSDKASLSIYGFIDGQRYLRSEKGLTSYHFVLPSTQDYVIVVVPASGHEVSYTMRVEIH